MHLHRHIQATDSHITLVLKEDPSIRIHTNPVRQDLRGQAQGQVKGRATNSQNTLGFSVKCFCTRKTATWHKEASIGFFEPRQRGKENPIQGPSLPSTLVYDFMHNRPIRRGETGGFSTPASALHESPPCGIKHALAKFQHFVAIICVIFYVPTIPNSAQTSFWCSYGVSWCLGAFVAQLLRMSQAHSNMGKEASRIDFLWASFSSLHVK